MILVCVLQDIKNFVLRSFFAAKRHPVRWGIDYSTDWWSHAGQFAIPRLLGPDHV